MTLMPCKCPPPGRVLCASFCLILALLWPARAGAAAVKGLYVGSDFYAPGTATQDAARTSGFTRLFLSFLHVGTNGDLTYNHTPVVQNGIYVGDPAWGAKLAALKIQPTSINRIELAVGGQREDASFGNIKRLIAAEGTGPGSMLRKNFQALKEATGVDAIQFVDEQTYDVASSVAFGKMIAGLGLKVTLCPYAAQAYWASVKSELGASVDAIYLQCYDAGAGNDPGSWSQAFGGFNVYPGLWGNSDTPASTMVKMRNWQQTLGITGGFIWLNGFMPDDSVKWAGALSYGLDSIACLRIINKNSGKSMNLVGGSITNGSIISQSGYENGNNQRWMLVPTEEGNHFKIASWVSGQCASIAYDSSLAGAQLWTWGYNNDPSQQFDLVDAGNGWFKIKNVRSGLVLEVAGGSTASEAALQQNVDTGAANQQWTLRPFGDALLASEDFDYPQGDLTRQDGGEGWNGGWLNNSDLAAKVSAGSLLGGASVPADYDARSVGNSVFIPNGERAGRYLDCSISGNFGIYGYLDPNGCVGADGTTLYLSFLQQPSKTSLFYEFELDRGAERVAGIGNDTHADGVNLRAPAETFTLIGPGDTNVNLYVMRIDFKPGDDDVRIYRNPTSATEPAEPTLTLPRAADMSFNRIALAAFANNNSVKFDQIRLASSWRYALAEAPEFAVQPASNIVSDDIFRRVRISGQVLYGNGQMYYLIDGNAGLRVLLSHPLQLEPGDLVEVAGLVEHKNQFVDLIEATARKADHLPLPQPRQLDIFDPSDRSPWVWVEGLLTGWVDSPTERTLELQIGPKKVVGRLRRDTPFPDNWPIGSRLKLTGVYVRHSGSQSEQETGTSLEIMLNSPAAIQITARPPWWTLMRALIIVGVLVAGLVLAFVWISLLRREVERRTIQWRREISKREKVEQERIIAEERSRISRDLHDDFGSKLTQISMLAWLPGEMSISELSPERLRLIGEKSRHMISALDEVVWMMNPKNETLSSVASYIAGHTEEFLSKTGIACRVEGPESYPAKVITFEARNNLFSSVKEAINNAVRHGQPTQLSLKFTVTEDTFTVEIHDNGRGFDPARVSSGNGLINLRERMLKLNGLCQIQTSLQGGTTVTLQLPLASSVTTPENASSPK